MRINRIHNRRCAVASIKLILTLFRGESYVRSYIDSQVFCLPISAGVCSFYCFTRHGKYISALLLNYTWVSDASEMEIKTAKRKQIVFYRRYQLSLKMSRQLSRRLGNLKWFRCSLLLSYCVNVFFALKMESGKIDLCGFHAERD